MEYIGVETIGLAPTWSADFSSHDRGETQGREARLKRALTPRGETNTRGLGGWEGEMTQGENRFRQGLAG